MHAETQKRKNVQGGKETAQAEAVGGKRTVSKRFRHKTIEERFAGFSGEYAKENIEWDEPEGNEVW